MKILRIVARLVKAIMKIIECSFLVTAGLFDKMDSIKTISPYIYQIFIIILDFVILDSLKSFKPIKPLVDYIDYGCPSIIGWFLQGLLLVFLSLFINACVEFFIRIILNDKAEEWIISIYDRQKQFYSYSMAFISIFAIYATLDSSRSMEINQVIFPGAILIVVCMIVTDIYFSLMSKKNLIKKIAEEFKDDIG